MENKLQFPPSIRDNTRKKKSIIVFFDTNAIYSSGKGFLIGTKLKDIILQYKSNVDIVVKWVLPDIVKNERRYQMEQEAINLKKHINSMEKVLWKKFNIDDNFIKKKVDLIIKKEIQKLSLTEFEIKPDRVNWTDLIYKSLNRIAPFEPVEREKNGKMEIIGEKGFRDALILENLVQFIEENKYLQDTIIYFYCRDECLKKATESRLEINENFQIVGDIDNLKEKLSIISSNIEVELCNELKDIAKYKFYSLNDKKTLYYKGNIRDKVINFENESEYKKLYIENARIDKYKVVVVDTIFDKRKEKRIFWVSSVKVFFSRYLESPRFDYENFTMGDYLEFGTSEDSSFNSLNRNYIKRRRFFDIDQILDPTRALYSVNFIDSGYAIFKINWSITLTNNNRLVRPQLEEVNCAEIDLDAPF